MRLLTGRWSDAGCMFVRVAVAIAYGQFCYFSVTPLFQFHSYSLSSHAHADIAVNVINALELFLFEMLFIL